jgi:3-methyladenine DNA glycosylase AlkD
MKKIIVIKQDFLKLANPKQAAILSCFFKTGPGEYAEGDKFYGIKVPETRKLVKKNFQEISLEETGKLLQSSFHEERLGALLILVEKFRQGDDKEKEKIYKLYLANTGQINNWDLVDLTAPQIVGAYLDNKPKDILFKLAGSKSLWERRIAILATFYFIKNGQPEYAFALADQLVDDKHDLIHKAVGWMLREAGKRCSEKLLEDYLKPRYKKMPRTMLRYAIERLPEAKRKNYLHGNI